MDCNEMAAVMIILAVGLSVYVGLDWSTHDEKPPPPVRLSDRRTWRRKRLWIAENWEHIIGAACFAAAICWAASCA